MVALDDEQGEERALATSAEGHRAPVVKHFQRSEDADVHVSPAEPIRGAHGGQWFVPDRFVGIS
jgi:hypothetical protein